MQNLSTQKNDYYKGKIIEMFNHRNEKNNNDFQDIIKHLETKIDDLNTKIEKNNEAINKEKKKGKLKFGLEIGMFALALIAALTSIFIYLDGKFSDINDQIANCLTEKNIESLRSTVEKLDMWAEGNINDKSKPGADKRISDVEDDIDEIKKGIQEINDTLHTSPINTNDSTLMSDLVGATSMENIGSPISTTFSLETFLGTDSDGNEYYLGDVIGEEVLLTYNEDDKEVYFYGKINEKLHWEGNCITNVYNSDETLYGICESYFDDGKRQNYASFYLAEANNEWIYTRRTCEDNGNLGISAKIKFEYNKTKRFTNANARIYDLLYIKDFFDPSDKTLLTYYSGYTLNGEYNDKYDYDKEKFERQPPYEIIFNSDGTIKTLYIGQFANGEFHDQTGNAREIVFDSYKSINKYFYYIGTFKAGKRDGKVSSKNYVTQTQINKIIEDMEFGIDLNWYKTGDDL